MKITPIITSLRPLFSHKKHIQKPQETIQTETQITPNPMYSRLHPYAVSMQGITNSNEYTENEKRFICIRDKLNQKLEPRRIQAEIACFNFDANSTKENEEKYLQAQDEYYKLYHDEEIYKELLDIKEKGVINTNLNNQLKKLIKSFDDELNTGEMKKAIRIKESEITAKYNSYVPQIDGQNTTLLEIRKIIQESKNEELRKKAYQAIVKGGDTISADIVDLVKMRNRYAQSKGYKNFFEYSLKETYEVSVESLQTMLDEVYEKSKDINNRLITENKKHLAEIFETKPENLQAYHYRIIPDNSPEQLVDKSLTDNEHVVDIAKTAFKNMGYDVDNLPIILDLFPRENKNTHCFGYEIDVGNDTRILANLTNNCDSIGSFCHELGHCVYFLNIDKNLPYQEKSTHDALTEAIAMMMEDLVQRENILSNVVPQETLKNFQQEYKNKEAKFINRSLEIINFEKSMYENPEQDLAKLWHDMRCKYLGANENEECDNEWATIPHYLSYPVYYQNYFRANIMKHQIYAHLTKVLGNITESTNTAQYLKENLFKYGTAISENNLIEKITQEPITTKYLCENLS